MLKHLGRRAAIMPADYLTLLFVGLKLAGYIGWAWFWVLSPTVVPIIILGALKVVLTIAGVTPEEAVKRLEARRAKRVDEVLK